VRRACTKPGIFRPHTWTLLSIQPLLLLLLETARLLLISLLLLLLLLLLCCRTLHRTWISRSKLLSPAA
jgi:hypothetical protein